jgi:hypothetical protein
MGGRGRKMHRIWKDSGDFCERFVIIAREISDMD